MSDTLSTPSPTVIRDAIRALLFAEDANAVIYPVWRPALAEGKNLNLARNASGFVKAVMFGLQDDSPTRVGDVPFDFRKVQDMRFARNNALTFRFFFVFQYDDEPDTNDLFSEDHFNLWLSGVQDTFSRAPKLNLKTTRVERHDELKILRRRIPSFGDEYAHAADGLLTVHLIQSVDTSPSNP